MPGKTGRETYIPEESRRVRDHSELYMVCPDFNTPQTAKTFSKLVRSADKLGNYKFFFSFLTPLAQFKLWFEQNWANAWD